MNKRKLVHFFIILFAVFYFLSLFSKQIFYVFGKGQILKVASQMLGVPVKTKKVSLQFLTGFVEIRDIKIANPPGYDTREALTIKKIFLDIGYLRSLFRQMIVIDKVIFESPVLNIEMKKNKKNNLAEIMAHLSQEQNPKKAPGPAPAFRIRGIFLRNGKIFVLDKQVPGEPAQITLDKLDFKIQELNSRIHPEEMSTVFKGKAVLEPEALIKINGKINPFKEKIDFDTSIIIEALRLEIFKPYFRQAPVKIERGDVFVKVNLKCRQAWLDGAAKVDVKKLIIKKTGGFLDGLVDFVKGSGGILRLNVPIYGNLKKPQVDVLGALGEVLAQRTEGAIKGFFKGLFHAK